MKNFENFPKTAFKFQSSSVLSLKTLLYGELFFSSNDELNDPYDTRHPYVFFKNQDRMGRLIKNFMCTDTQVSKSLSCFVKVIDINRISSFLSKTDLLFEEIISLIESKEFEYLVQDVFAQTRHAESIGVAEIFRKHLKKFIQIKLGNLAYIISFSKTCDDPVMWSHYADQHRGMCLCFALNDQLIKVKEGFKNGLLQKEYKLKEVNYSPLFITTDAYYGFSKDVFGEDSSTIDPKKNFENLENSFLTKYESWKYEQEIRMLDFNMLRSQVIGDDLVKWDTNERIFHYDQEQLTGIIFGSRMDSGTKKEVKSIISKVRDGMTDGIKALPIFTFYESKKTFPDYKMKICHTEGLDSSNRHFEYKDINRVRDDYVKMKEIEKRKY